MSKPNTISVGDVYGARTVTWVGPRISRREWRVRVRCAAGHESTITVIGLRASAGKGKGCSKCSASARHGRSAASMTPLDLLPPYDEPAQQSAHANRHRVLRKRYGFPELVSRGPYTPAEAEQDRRDEADEMSGVYLNSRCGR